MANISGSGAPNKQTIGSVGDIYTNENTSEQYECVAVYKLHTHKGIVTEYDWDLIIYTNTGEGGGGSGVSPTITVTEINGGHRLRITDVNGTKSFDVMDGEVGPQGSQGIQGENAVSAINPRGDYDVSTDPSYTVSDYITHTDGNTYVCKVDNPTNIAPVDGSADDPYWQLLALRGATGPQGIQGFPGERGIDGNDGVGIAKVEKIATDDLVDTYQITFTDGTHFKYQITNGADGAAGSGADIEVDSEMSDTSTNPVQNAVVKKYIDEKGITVSAEADNAIEKKADGIYVADRSAEIEAMSDKVSGISEYRKYVNTELEYCSAYGNVTTDLSGTGDISSNPVLLEMSNLKGNMKVTSDNYVVLKAGKTYQIDASIRFVTNSGTSSLIVSYALMNVNTKAAITPSGAASINSCIAKSAYGNRDLVSIVTPKEDVTATIGVTYVAGTISKYAMLLSIHEINKAITIDPLEHANSTDGVEDAPVGHIISYMGLTAPAHYLACDGTEYNISDYPYLSQHFIDQFGSVNYFGGDGTTTFAVPDLRGEFLRGTGTATRNTGGGASVGKHQDGTKIPFIQAYSNGSAYFSGYDDNTLFPATVGAENATKCTSGKRMSVQTNLSTNSDPAIINYTSRPTNTSVLYCIKYEPTYFMQNTYIGNEEVVLWEGSQLVDCSTDGTVTGLGHTITLTDDMRNYDKIEIRYGACTLNNEIFSYPRVEQIIPSEVDTEANYGDIVVGIYNATYSFVASGYFKDNQTLVITISKAENTAKTQLEALNIYRIVGYRTSLTEHGQYTDEEITSLVDEIWSE